MEGQSQVYFKSSDGHVLEVPREIADMRVTIKSIEARALPNPLPNITAETCSSPLITSFQEIREYAKRALQRKDLFSPWYFGHAVEDLLKQIRVSRAGQPQERHCIGLVQATRTGKTRLLLEASKRTALIMIRLDDSNVVYKRLCHLIEKEEDKLRPDTSFQEWRAINQRVVLYIRHFFLSHMQYASDYKKSLGVSGLFDPSKQADGADEIDLFNTSLLGCGRRLIAKLFDYEAAQIVDLQDSGDLGTAARQSELRRSQLSKQLHQPTLAIDQCHVTLSEARGVLFHSDYESHSQADVLARQRHELFGMGKHSGRRSPYDEKTTLFSGFRWVLREYLIGDEQQTSVFSSTHFAAWAPLQDTIKRSRSELRFSRVYLDTTLTLENITAVLGTHGFTMAELQRDEIKSMLREWCGRAGFFFLYLLRYVVGHPGCSLLQANKEAKHQLKIEVFGEGLRQLGAAAAISASSSAGGSDEKDALDLLYDRSRTRCPTIKCATPILARLVSAGLAQVRNYDPSGGSVGDIAEPLAHDFLAGLARRPNAYTARDLAEPRRDRPTGKRRLHMAERGTEEDEEEEHEPTKSPRASKVKRRRGTDTASKKKEKEPGA